MLVSLTDNAIGSKIGSTCGEGHYRLAGWRTNLCVVTGNLHLRCLSVEIDELEELLVVGYIGRILAVLLSFKHGVDVQFELEYRCDRGSRGFILHHLQSSDVLLHKVVQAMQFLATAIFSAEASKVMWMCV